MILHPSYEICGCDVSRWQTSIDFDKLLAKGIRFMIAKSSEGSFPDSKYNEHKAGAEQNDLPFGAYHYWRPGYTASANADAMIKQVPTLPQMRCWLDIEAQIGEMSRRSATLHILDTLDKLDYWYGDPIGLYSNKSSWARIIDPAYYNQLKLDERPLWVANYLTGFNQYPYSMPDGWPYWALWQFSAGVGPYAGKAAEFGIVGTKSLDINAFYGSEQDFQTFIGETTTPPVEPPVEPPVVVTTRVRVSVEVANVRNAPVLAEVSDIGNLVKGAVLDVTGEIVNGFYPIRAYVAKSVVTPLSEPPTEPLPPTVPEYYVNHDWETGELWRGGVPEVFHFDQDAPTKLTEAWQYRIRDLNPGMTNEKLRALCRWNTAFTNDAGFDNPNGNLYADYFNRVDLDQKFPVNDKCRCCGGAILHGIENGGILTVETLDGSQAPPSLEWILARPWLYFKAVTIGTDGKNYNFPQNGGKPVYWPLVATGRVTVKIGYKAGAEPYPYVTRKA